MITKFIIKENNSPHRQPSGWRRRPLHRAEDIGSTIEELLRHLDAAGYSVEERFAVHISVEEALVNAIKHGHQGDPSKEVQLRYLLAPDYLLVEIEDQGPGFKLEDVPDPFAPENLDRACGRGLLLMRSYMTWVRFNDTGNRVTMYRHRLSA
jgi:serine/threonine-protein kinase RsbW